MPFPLPALLETVADNLYFFCSTILVAVMANILINLLQITCLGCGIEDRNYQLFICSSFLYKCIIPSCYNIDSQNCNLPLFYYEIVVRYVSEVGLLGEPRTKTIRVFVTSILISFSFTVTENDTKDLKK